MNLGRLEGFYWVAREGGYSRAARAFPYPISQPGVYQQVKKLEAELGRPLFDRIGKDQLRLTAAGERLFEFCQPFFEALPTLVEAIRSDELAGTLRLDASGLILRELVPQWVQRWRKAMPNVSVDVQELQVVDFDRLRTGAAHLIVDHCDQIPPDIDHRVVATAYAFLVVPDEHRKIRRSALAELARLPFVSYHPSLPHYALQMRALREHIGTPHRTVSASSVDAILAFVRAGLGFSVVPWLDRRGPRQAGVAATRVTGPGTRFPIAALWRRGDHPLVRGALAALQD
ncbi:MAG: LysR family transcriptional regulator [Polyangiaceae bacterium]